MGLALLKTARPFQRSRGKPVWKQGAVTFSELGPVPGWYLWPLGAHLKQGRLLKINSHPASPCVLWGTMGCRWRPDNQGPGLRNLHTIFLLKGLWLTAYSKSTVEKFFRKIRYLLNKVCPFNTFGFSFPHHLSTPPVKRRLLRHQSVLPNPDSKVGGFNLLNARPFHI